MKSENRELRGENDELQLQLQEAVKQCVGMRSSLGSEVGSLKEFAKNLIGILREFDRIMHVFLILRIRNSL
jgi:hypothetical protein